MTTLTYNQKKMRYIVVELSCTGIDPNTDRIVEIACKDLESGLTYSQLIDPQTIVPTAVLQATGCTLKRFTTCRQFREVMDDVLKWMSSLDGDSNSAHSQEIILIAHNGHGFCFPMITKEMRRSKTLMTRKFLLWDTFYALRQYNSRKSLDQHCLESKGYVCNALSKIEVLHDLFHQMTGSMLRSDRGIEILRSTNEEAMKQNPQQPFHTRYISINSL